MCRTLKSEEGLTKMSTLLSLPKPMSYNSSFPPSGPTYTEKCTTLSNSQVKMKAFYGFRPMEGEQGKWITRQHRDGVMAMHLN